jgi:hypothetical protein
MKNGFVADGHRRFNLDRKSVTPESIEKKYAGELAGASPDQKHQIRARMAEELLRRAKTESHKPSVYTLW